MGWVEFVLVAVVIWAICNIMLKYITGRFIRNVVVLAMGMGFVLGIISLLIIPFTGLYFPSFLVLIAALVSGILYVIALIPFLKSLIFEELSRVVPLWQFIPIFVLILAFVFLGERLTVNSYIAFAFLVAGGFFISVKRVKGLFRLSKAFFLMLLSSFLFAIYIVLIKYVFSNTSYWNGFIWIRFGSLLVAVVLLFFAKPRRDFVRVWKNLSKGIKSIFITEETLNFAGLIFLNYAVAIASVSMVYALERLQPFVLLVFTLILSRWFPKILKEEVNVKVIVTKFVAILLMFAGILFIYL